VSDELLPDEPLLDTRGLQIRPDPAPLPEGPHTIAGILVDGVHAHPEREALVQGADRLTYRELDERVTAAAGGLAALGIGPGDRVAASLPNRTALVEAFLATQRLGAIWLGINTNLTAPEARWMLDDSEASLLLTTPDRGIDIGDDRTLTIDPTTGAGSWVDLVAAGHPQPEVEVDPHAPAAIAYTSGTTGHPKGAVHSQHNIIWSGISSRTSYPAIPDERHGTALACTILNLLLLGPVWSFVRGTTAVLIDRTDPVGMTEVIRAEGISRMTLVPTLVHDLVEHPDVGREDLAGLVNMVIGAAHTPPELRQRWYEKFGTWPMVGYGLTEAPSGVVRDRAGHQKDGQRNDGTAGYPLDPVEVLVVDEDGAEVPAGEVGEVCFRARTDGRWAGVWTPMLGYWNRPEATRAALRGSLLHTGDLGELDADGQLMIRGRQSQLILRGGANVYPTEVERVLLTHPEVAEAAVLGLPDARLGERVVAAVVPATGCTPDPVRLAAHCAVDLARYKVPDRFLIVDELPRNALGKVVLRDLLPRFED
jgi:acyl-CoA synthetase (AMP-forming)/AMP-acid ligase II